MTNIIGKWGKLPTFPTTHQQFLGGKDTRPLHVLSDAACAGPLGIQMYDVRMVPNTADRQSHH